MKVRLKDLNGIYEFDFSRRGELISIRMGGNEFTYRLLKQDGGEILLEDRETIIPLGVFKDRGHIWVAVRGRVIVFAEVGEEGKGEEGGMEGEDLNVVAPMPGTVIKIMVTPGQQVKRGEPIAAVEAMKMENIVKAPGDAVVVKVLTQPGQQVGYGEKLIELGPIPSGEAVPEPVG